MKQRFQIFSARTYQVTKPNENQSIGDTGVVLDTIPLDYVSRKPRTFFLSLEDLELLCDFDLPKEPREFNVLLRDKILFVEQKQELLSVETEEE